MSILKRRDEEARKVNRVRKIWQAAKRDMRNNRRAARRGAPDRTLEIMSKYEPVMGDRATAGLFSGEAASGMIDKAEDHFRDMQRLREQKRMQNQKNIDLMAGGAEPGDDVFEPDPSFYTDEKQTNRGTFGDASLRKPATASSNKADDINTLNEDGTTKGVYSPRKPYVDTVQRNALSRELDKIRRGAEDYRRSYRDSRNPAPESVDLTGVSLDKFTPKDFDRFQVAARIAETELKYGTSPMSGDRAETIILDTARGIDGEYDYDQQSNWRNVYDRYVDKADKNKKTRAESAYKKSKAALGVDDDTLKSIEAISNPEIQNKLLNDLGIDPEAWDAYTMASKTASE